MKGLCVLVMLAAPVAAAQGPDAAVTLPGVDAPVEDALRVAAPPVATSYPTPSAALRAVLGSQPRVLAVGEFHQTKATSRIPSALHRFSHELLPVVRAAGATDLVVETWLARGACGETEHEAVAQVEKTTERPARTENEVVTLLERAKAAGLVPRILEVACKDYQALMGGGEVDFERLLRLTRDQLEAQLRVALSRPGSRMVVSYGGALHNDLEPTADLAPYAFGPAIAAATSGSYVELDLYVPEFLAASASIRREPWFSAYRRAARPGRVTLVRRGQASYALVFPPSRRPR